MIRWIKIQYYKFHIWRLSRQDTYECLGVVDCDVCPRADKIKCLSELIKDQQLELFVLKLQEIKIKR